MRRVVFAIAAVACLSGVEPAQARRQPVVVVTERVELTSHDRLRLDVACRRERFACRGEVVVGQQQLCGGVPVADPSCQVVLGRGRFDVPARRRARVTVRRVPGPSAISRSRETVDVIATPYLRPRRGDRVGPRSRRVRLGAPAAVARPPADPRVTRVERLSSRAPAVRASAIVPAGTGEARVELPGTTIPMHQDRFTGYVTARNSFAVGGERWHGEAPASSDSPSAGQRVPARLISCAAGRCTTRENETTVFDDPGMGPICHLPSPAFERTSRTNGREQR